jgi:hypothetical protein
VSLQRSRRKKFFLKFTQESKVEIKHPCLLNQLIQDDYHDSFDFPFFSLNLSTSTGNPNPAEITFAKT